MWAMIVKEFRQVRRDRRTLAMMIVMPVLLLVVLGYAASFDVKTISVAVSGPQDELLAQRLPAPFDVKTTAPGQGAGPDRRQPAVLGQGGARGPCRAAATRYPASGCPGGDGAVQTGPEDLGD